MHVQLKKEDHSKPGLFYKIGKIKFLYAFTKADRVINLQSCDLLVP